MEDYFGGFDTDSGEGGELCYCWLVSKNPLPLCGIPLIRGRYSKEWGDSLESLLVELDEELGCGIDMFGFAIM